MKKIWLSVILLFTIAINANAAMYLDELDELTSPANDDILLIGDQSAATAYTNKYITKSNLLAGLATLAGGNAFTGANDFGGATSVEIPNGNDPTTDAAGEIALDVNNAAIEVYAANSRLIPTLYLASVTIFDPDTIQGTSDALPIFAVEAEAFPFGITIVDCGIKTNSSSSYSLNFEEWTAPDDGSPSTIETVATSSSYEAEDDGTLSDASIAAGSIVYVDLPTTDVNYLQVWFTFYINPGN